jgi:hypothetical protein
VLRELVAAEGISSRRARKAADKEHVPIELTPRNLEEQSVAEAVGGEKAGPCEGGFTDDLGVRLQPSGAFSALDAVGANLCGRPAAYGSGRLPAKYKTSLNAGKQGAGGQRISNQSQV